MRRGQLAAMLLGVSTAHAAAAEWHVDATRGDDARAGTEVAPFRTIMRAVAVVNPGDTVLVHPGIYFEPVKLERAGTAEAPITFRAAGKSGETIVTGAHRALREGRVKWERVAGDLWRVPLPEEPATLLCDELNLYRYPSLEELRTFTVRDVALQKRPAPGPRHGWAWSDGHLHMRLRDAADPHRHTMKASPARGGGFRGDEIDARTRANFLLFTPDPAHVVIEGFTFESPGFCGVWVRHGSAVVRGCKFLGCRTAVRGWDRPEKRPRDLSEDVLVERCEFTEHPTYSDVAEVIGEVTALSAAERARLARFFWWHRKGGSHSSEVGFVTAAGRRWVIRDNFIHDTFDGLGFLSLGWSEDCVVEGNRFERIVDNAIEAENHAQRLRVRGNVIVDCFEPFSYQPLGGEPWPADILFVRNTVTFTRAGAALWGDARLGWRPGCCKIFAPPGLAAVPGGLVFRENLMVFPTGALVSLNAAATALHGVAFERNVIAVQTLGGTEDGNAPQHFHFAGNAVAALADENRTAMQALAAEGGALHPSLEALGVVRDTETGRAELRSRNPAIGAPWKD